jgi:two-component system response regulator YesN
MFTMLVVDDNTADRKGIKGLIDWGSLGIEITGVAANGLEGYHKALDLMPDFVLTDVSMPVMDGIDMTRKLKKQFPRTKVIFMSCFDEFDYVKNAMDLEVCSYVLKPIKLDELIEAAKKMVNLLQEEMDRLKNEEEMKKQLQKSIPLLQEQFIRDLLYGKLTEEKDIKERMRYLGIEFSSNEYTVVFIQIDNYEREYQNLPADRKYFLMHQVNQIIEDVLFNHRTGYTINQQQHSLAILIFTNPKSLVNAEESLNQVIESLQLCKHQINKQLGVKVTVGIGHFSQRLSEISRVFESAEHAVKSRFFSEGNRLILASEVHEPNAQARYDLNTLKKEISEAMEADLKGVQAFIDKYLGTGERYAEGYVKSLAVAITSTLQVILSERGESFKSVFGEDGLIWDDLYKLETISDIKSWLIHVLEEKGQILKQKDNVRYEKIVEDVKKTIRQNYAKIENVNQITDPIYLSAGYANHIFKQHTGKTIFDYLVEVRMETAKKLLCDPYCRVYEVAEKLGYKSTTYFSTTFKDFTGISPKEYRDKYSESGQ